MLPEVSTPLTDQLSLAVWEFTVHLHTSTPTCDTSLSLLYIVAAMATRLISLLLLMSGDVEQNPGPGGDGGCGEGSGDANDDVIKHNRLYLQPEEHLTSVGRCGGLEVSGHRAGY